MPLAASTIVAENVTVATCEVVPTVHAVLRAEYSGDIPGRYRARLTARTLSAMSRVRAWVAEGTPLGRLAAALGVAALLLIVISGRAPVEGEPRGLDALAAVLVAAAAVLVLAGARRFPATVALIELGLSLAWYSLGYESRLIDAPTLIAFFVLGAIGRRARELAVAGLAIALLMAAVVADQAAVAFAGVGWTVAAVLGGEMLRARNAMREQYAERAARAEAERDRRVAEERMRVARDVHDVLAHTVSVMTVQAGVAADALERDPAAAASALARVRAAGREAMAEVRATVAALRAAGSPDTEPVPGLERIDDVVRGARGQGLIVDLAREGTGAEVPSLVALTAYRVVQEAMTNVIRHAGATRARVRVTQAAEALRVEVDDDGRGVGTGVAAGFGLSGMAERVEALGGELAWGPARGGGWIVRATIPLDGGAA